MGFALQKHDAGNMRDTVVIGLGETGLSVAHYLSQRNIAFTMMDTRSNPPQLSMFQQEYPDVDVYLEASAIDLLKENEKAAQLIVSPGVDTNNENIREAITKNNYECIGDIELFARGVTAPVVAITGSNGKSTVTSLFAEMARSAGVAAYAGGNLGPPALDLLSHENAQLFVLELSSFQLESIQSLQPEVSVVLNISPDHLDRHGDVNSYAKIKQHIYSNASVSVINRDDEYVSAMNTSGNVISFGLDQPEKGEFGVISIGTDKFLAYGENRLIPTSELGLKGESGILNALAALAIGHALNLPMQKMLTTLKNFKGLPHRLALVVKQKGIAWFNDSKGTNIGATISSLRSLNANIILIAGGVFKGGDLEQLREVVSKHAKRVILLGQDASILQETLGSIISIDMASSMQEAVKIAQSHATSGDQVLLSPACASFDMYSNYIERGNDYEKHVRALVS